jgi:hypothetical protein
MTGSYCLEVLDGAQKGARIPIPPDGGTIGRHSRCSFVLEGASVEDFHAQLYFDGEQPCVLDLASSAGTSVNGSPVQQQVLKHGDFITIDANQLRLVEDGGAPNTRPPLNSTPASDFVPPLPARSTAEWHYEVNAERMGPVSDAELRRLITSQKLRHGALVWKKGMSKWTPFEDTELAAVIDGPPPLTGTAVGSGLAWLLAFAPLLGLMLEGFLAGAMQTHISNLWWVTVILNVLIAGADEKVLKRAGHDTSKMGSIFLIPVYLYKRSEILKHGKGYFIVWCVGFLLVLLSGATQ